MSLHDGSDLPTAVQITLAAIANAHFNKAISLAHDLVPKLRAAATSLPPDATFSSIEGLVQPARQIYDEVVSGCHTLPRCLQR